MRSHKVDKAIAVLQDQPVHGQAAIIRKENDAWSDRRLFRWASTTWRMTEVIRSVWSSWMVCPRSGYARQHEVKSYQVSGFRTPATTCRIASMTSAG